jgi:radical SAM superfamily enzyme YgiQ (UPF0313 family)
MTKFERWFIKRIFERDFRQSHYHYFNIAAVYALIREVARKEFYEDNDITLETFLQELFLKSCSVLGKENA